MRLRDLPGYLRDTALRILPHATRTGLVRIGHPGPDDPVLLTGNFTLTVRRLRDTLAGQDAWLLCADSNGINVWCAAGGGHLTHHDVISVIRTSGIEANVSHREIVLPQLCATGVERRKITEATGWAARWGPARLEDLPGFLDHGYRVRRGERRMRFPLWERTEMASMWAVPTLAIALPLLWWLAGVRVLAATAIPLVVVAFVMFAILPYVSLRGARRWLTVGGAALGSAALGVAILLALHAATGAALVATCVLDLFWALLLSVDLEGSTPWYRSYINTFHNSAHIELVESKCDGSADCVLVCPSDVLQMDGPRRKVRIERPDQCIQCGACIVQCPTDALRFRYEDGTVVEAPTIRSTRMNLLGKRRKIPVETPS